MPLALSSVKRKISVRKKHCPRRAAFLHCRQRNFPGIVQLKTITAIKWFRPAVGAALATLCGLLLWWSTPIGDAWVNASFDYLLPFGSRPVTNQVVLIQYDNEAYHQFKQTRGQPWNRALLAGLLNRLADDGCGLVVLDSMFDELGDPDKDAALAAALQRQGRVVLMAGQAGRKDEREVESVHPTLPLEPFLSAAGANNWGVAWLDSDLDTIVRRHWPFPAPGPYESLAWRAAQLRGAPLPQTPQEQWLRYYDRDVALKCLSFGQALEQTTNFFRGAVVFIGSKPGTTSPNNPEMDKFSIPATRWTGEAVGGLEIQAMEFLNLMNGDWLRRPAAWVEFLLLLATGVTLGGGACLMRRRIAGPVAVGVALVVTFGFVVWSYYSNYWFPWLVIAGGQVPCALVWALLTPKPQTEWTEKFPGYTVLGEPFGEGAFGKVWLVRNALGQLQALKEIELAKFADRDPYDREFAGIKNYKPISNRHLGLMNIEHVNRNDRNGYFYYVMELGDAMDPDWEQKGEPYRPCVLSSVYQQSLGGRLPARECVRIGILLLEALDFLHQQGLVHRDIKPANIIFANGRPKLADVGLVRRVGDDVTRVGTDFYMPPEGPGRPPADIYALGMVLYVISTGKHPRLFSELPTTLVAKPEFMRLNQIICRACQPAPEQRFGTAAEMLLALREVQAGLDAEQTRRI